MAHYTPFYLKDWKINNPHQRSGVGALKNVPPLNVARGMALSDYRLRAADFLTDILHWKPWSGAAYGVTGQLEIVETYNTILCQQEEQSRYEAGLVTEQELRVWYPGQPIQNRLHIATGHGIGKTFLAAGLVLHHLYTLGSIIYTFAPTWNQIHDLLWKEIGVQHASGKLPGRVGEDCVLRLSHANFATGRATHDAGGLGSERIQGQHAAWMLFVLDEAEGIESYVWNAVDAMSSGGNCVVVELGNPRTQTSEFYVARERRDTITFHISSFDHPNVITGKDIIPGAVRRDYIELMVEKHCEPVEQHDAEAGTFELPWQPGTMYLPLPEMQWRVLGIAPPEGQDDSLVTPGRFDGAVARRVEGNFSPIRARIGIDVARWGNDKGTAYITLADKAQRVAYRLAVFARQDSVAYTGKMRECLIALKVKYPRLGSVHIRVDGTGGFGSGVVDILRTDAALLRMFPDFQVIEVNFSSSPTDKDAFEDIITELYAATQQALTGLVVSNPPTELRTDLTDRKYRWTMKSGQAVKAMEKKDKFRDRHHRSSDDGDGFVLSVTPDYLYTATSARLEAIAVAGERTLVNSYRPR